MTEQEFRQELESLLNRNSMENGSDTPDFLLAEFLVIQLNTWDQFVQRREQWHGREIPNATLGGGLA